MNDLGLDSSCAWAGAPPATVSAASKSRPSTRRKRQTRDATDTRYATHCCAGNPQVMRAPALSLLEEPSHDRLLADHTASPARAEMVIMCYPGATGCCSRHDFGRLFLGTAEMSNATETVSIPLDPGWGEIRDGVRHICERFPNEYWVKLDHDGAYPDRVRRRADRGRLPRRADPGGVRRRRSAAVGRLRHPGDHPRDRLQRRGLPRPDVHHGHGAAARQRGAEAEVPAGHRLRRAQAAGLRRHRAHHRLRHHPAQDPRRQEGQRPLRRQRPEGVDLAACCTPT